MPRPSGAKSKHYQTKRRVMLERIGARLANSGGKAVSWREMAEAAGVGLATLTHYFGKREDVIRALMTYWGELGRDPLNTLSRATGPFEQSVNDAIHHLALGFQHGVGDILGIGLAESITNTKFGPLFIKTNLEPLIAAAAERLREHQSRGEMQTDVDARSAALTLVSPVVLAYLHQHHLGGRDCYPLDLEAFQQQHAAFFISAYGKQT